MLAEDGLFDAEYADIFGIPFDFTAKPQVAPVKPPKKMTRVAAMLGYSEPSVLTRSCHRWFGASPRKFRKDMSTDVEL